MSHPPTAIARASRPKVALPEQFGRLLAPFDLDVVDDEPSTVYGLTEDLRLGYVNRAWSAFANANGASWNEGAWGIGSRVMDAIPDVLRPFYAGLFAQALSERAVVEHDYECSSPTQLRRFRMRIHPCDSGALLVVHSRIEEQLHTAAEHSRGALYGEADGLITQCSHCRRVQRVDGTREWDWVPEYVARPLPTISHGLCNLCVEYYYSNPEGSPGLFIA
ncbi:MAG: hypothetical protein ABI551_24800 [Polyangiaceae bacterium]